MVYDWGMAAKSKVPLFTNKGDFRGRRSESQIEAMLKAGLIAVIRTRKGRICRAHQLPNDSSPTLSINAGQRLSHQEHLESGHRVWQHHPKLLSGLRS